MSNSQPPPKPPSRRAAREARKAREAATAPKQYFQPPPGNVQPGNVQPGNVQPGAPPRGNTATGPQQVSNAPTRPHSSPRPPTGPHQVSNFPTGPHRVSNVPTGPQPVPGPPTGPLPTNPVPPRQTDTPQTSEGGAFTWTWTPRSVLGLVCYIGGILLYGLKHLIALPLIVVAPVAAVLIFVAVEVIIRLRGRATWAALGLAGVAIVVLRLVVGR